MTWTFNPVAYGPAVAELLTGDRLPELGPGRANAAARPLLEQLTVERLVPGPIADADMARCCLAALWLHHDFLDESHKISQDDESDPDRNFWHAVMHRREPDPSNSKYWWRQVGPHPVLARLREHAPTLGYEYTTPEAFVDFCERVRSTGSDDEDLAKSVQMLEWQLLFDCCYYKAVPSG